MWRKILLSISLSVAVFAISQDQMQNQNFELLADDVSKNGDVLTATKNVVVYSQTYLITADKAIYNQTSEIIELFGNVNMMRGANEISRSSYVKINLKNDTLDFETLFMMDKDLEVWMQSDESSSDENYYRTKGAVVSSCNVKDPDWSITATTAKLNKQSKFLHLYNPLFRVNLPLVGNTPVFYLPYFGFPTDTTRRTGLLPLDAGYSKSEGVYYKQPIYFAPYNSWDFQTDFQIRTRRGMGLNNTLRFTDSPYSYGYFSFGGFRDKDVYRQRQSVKNSNLQALKYKTHYGVELFYDRSNLFKEYISPELQEGLYLNTTILNDVEYLNLKGRGDDADSLVTSKLNYFLSEDDHYFATYARYYIDTQKIGSTNKNKDTLQELPAFQYHKFSNSFVLPNLIYSLDVQSHRYDRKIGVKATQYELNLPVSLHLPLLDEYLTFSFYENLYASHIRYDNKRISAIKSDKDKRDNFVNNYHRFAIHTDLAKAYDSFFHTLNFGAEYILPGINNGDLSDEFIYDLDGKGYENFLAAEHKKQEIAGYVTQYFYTSNGRKFLRHSVSQSYYTKDSELGNLKNSIAFYPFVNLTLFNKVEYSHLQNKIVRMQSGINYSADMFSIGINHTFRRRTDAKHDSYLTTNAAVKLPYFYKFLGAWQYDLERDYTKMWRLGLAHNRKCWNYSLIYQSDYEPVTTKTGSAIKRTQGVMFMVNFYPMGGVSYDFSMQKDPSSVE
ncbi:LPS-assembly protein LptD [Campylobacter majalis]|uniref:LPS-assembly protein LptD n=1 Tax=Campylobacter majalis TaxID=2790656 RepID=A0ABM8Q1J9_9BACT|nr:LPS-assembly protein LptD [Campylobacter majalis]CAD7286693.1 LPS-assembly protein LptD [Campylobacter majalis]